MRSVRCDVCGVKALIAASSCPMCHHELRVRDPAGELLPLSFCSSCDSYYPAKVGSCKWCGTQPERAPIAPTVWRAAGIVAFLSLAAVGWFSRYNEPRDVADDRLAPAPRIDSATVPVDTATSQLTVASAGSIDTTFAAQPDTAAALPLDTVAAPTAAPPPVASSGADARIAAVAPSKSQTTRAAKTRTTTRWVSSVSRNWVVVRASPNRNARIVASLGPRSRVQLGEARGEWRRVRAKGLAGWVEHRAFFADTRRTGGTRGLAQR